MRRFAWMLGVVIASAATGGCAAGGNTPGGAAPPPPKTERDVFRVVALTHGKNPQSPAWYQVIVTLLDENGASVFPDGAYTVRVTPPVGADGRPPVLGGVVWDRFEAPPIERRLKAGRKDEENRGKTLVGEWREWRSRLQLPREELAEHLPVGSTGAQITVEFTLAAGKLRAAPASFEMALYDPGPEGEVGPRRASTVGIRAPQTPAERLVLERSTAAGDPLYEELFVTLLDGRGGHTLPSGELRVWAAPRAAGQTAAPADPAAYVPIPLLEPPTRIGRRLCETVRTDNSPRIEHRLRTEFRQRVVIERSRMPKSAGTGSTAAWIRVEFVPTAGPAGPAEAVAVGPGAG